MTKSLAAALVASVLAGSGISSLAAARIIRSAASEREHFQAAASADSLALALGLSIKFVGLFCSFTGLLWFRAVYFICSCVLLIARK